MSLPRLALAASLVLAASCAPMPTIQHDVCGNAIIDPGEDCDTFAIGDSECRAPGEAGACHLDCSKSGEGERGACPEGWGCSVAGICQRATEDFDEPVAFEAGSDLTLLSGDFDGDGRSDLVGQEQLDAVQRTRLRFHYFDAAGRLSDTRAFPKVLTAPVVAELSKDDRSDVLFSDQRLGLLLGSDDRSWVPEAFGSYRVQDHPLLMFQLTIYEGAPVVAVSTLEDVTGLFIPIEDEGELRLVLTLPKGVEALVGPPVTGNVIEGDLRSPCDEAALAYLGATAFSLIDLCFRGGRLRATSLFF